jgi:hypothetical protein
MTPEAPVRRMAGRGRQLIRGMSTRPGVDHLVVDELVSPLRYDVLVRADLFAAMKDAGSLDESFVEAVASDSAYGVWFKNIAVARFHPHLLTDEQALRSALRARVRAAIRLWRSYSRQGFDRRHPILVRAALPGARTATGKHVSRAFHVSDGCHRLALLLASGYRELPPSHYRVDARRLPAIPDNTARLIGPLAIDESEYARFIGRGFGIHDVDDVVGLLTAVEHHQRDLLDDVVQIVRADIVSGLRIASDGLRAVADQTRGYLPQ